MTNAPRTQSKKGDAGSAPPFFAQKTLDLRLFGSPSFKDSADLKTGGGYEIVENRLVNLR